ncbi:MAG: hypothetical protein K2Q22_11500 [Cytophagales bacterium]|nr:hypothetical protein [Cytophagales bacterium]
MNVDFLYKFVETTSSLLNISEKSENQYFSSVLPSFEANAFVRDNILSQRPFMAARFGHAEYQCIQAYLDIASVKKMNWLKGSKAVFLGKKFAWDKNIKLGIERNAGFFPPSDTMLERFAQMAIDDSSLIDLIGIWGNMKDESGYYQMYCPQAKLTDLPNLEPYYHEAPWSLALEGKRVLVIHPFDKSIQQNYSNRDKLFPFPVLPTFELITLKAIQTIAYNRQGFENWFQALDIMCERVSRIDYDVMIVGAGAYGMPLAAFAKRMGKQSVHLGGATQILFGIRGKRWDNIPKISALFNSYWTRPLENEKPLGHDKIENGCYW